jgi:exopolyphosphatase/guanosine-5'-triphosphate,3'-diphosphate pyrophosphatase
VRVGIIDLGTKSVRFDVNQIGPGTRVRKLHREKLMVRLGQNLFLDGKLDPAAIRRTLQAFHSFQRTAADLQVAKIVAFGTSALREAGDSDRLLNAIRNRTGIDVRVISGQEEAQLIAKGIIFNEKALTKGRYGLIDIGGGSTEISVCRGKEVVHGESFPLGTARLQQVFLKSSPPRVASKKELAPVEQLRRYIRSIILPKLISEEWPKVERLLGSSGTIRAIGKIVKKSGGGKAIDLKELKKLVKSMSEMTTTELLGIPGMEARRVDMILAGAILLEECMLMTGAKKVFATEYSLRDGILEEEIRLYKQHEVSNIPFHLKDLYAKAQRFKSGPDSSPSDEGHLKQTVELAETLFDRLKGLHKLNAKWRHYLTAASILHDVGEAISRSNHGRHSYYIVKNADLPSMEKWETEFVAQLCLWHQDGKVESKDLPFGQDKERKQAFMKLLAILRVADALDRSHKRLLKIRDVKIERKAVRLLISSRNGIDLELLRMEQKKALFEQLFKRPLVVEKISGRA